PRLPRDSRPESVAVGDQPSRGRGFLSWPTCAHGILWSDARRGRSRSSRSLAVETWPSGAGVASILPVVSTHHSIVVAKSATPLPLLPEVRSAFGTSCFNLVCHEDGWQMAEINVRAHQWATVGSGPGPVADATGAPVLAAWISDIGCAQMAADVPGGPSWT